MRSDLRGFGFGLGLGVAALAGFGASQLAPTEPTEPAPAIEPTVGRYQIAVGGSDRDRYRAYVLDTATGEVWEEQGRGFVKQRGSTRRRSRTRSAVDGGRPAAGTRVTERAQFGDPAESMLSS